MHTPRMNFRQSMSLNEAVMEAMTGRMSDSKIKADLEKMSDKELKDTIKLIKAMKDNQELISKAAFDTAEEMGLMEMEEETGPMGGRGGGAAPPTGGGAAGGAARMGERGLHPVVALAVDGENDRTFGGKVRRVVRIKEGCLSCLNYLNFFLLMLIRYSLTNFFKKLRRDSLILRG